MKVSGRYIIHEKIGQGGMGAVYRATDRLKNQTIALKKVTIHNPQTDVFKFALANEFQTLASLRHPNIISVLDYGFDLNQEPYFTMNYLSHSRTILEASIGLAEESKIKLIQQLLQGLAYLHRHGILHRDLKPGNVLVADQSVYILDFGLASTSKRSVNIAGSMPYIAPEILQEQTYSKASDLYSVGIIAFEMFAGRHPFNTTDIQVFLYEVVNTPPDLDLIEANQAIKSIIGKLLHKDQNGRFPNANICVSAFCNAINIPLPEENPAVRESFLRAAKFIGRKSEKTQLLTALKNAREGKGSSWLVRGESGVGKTRLLNEIGTQALVQGALVLRGQANKDINDSPLYLWQGLLRHLIELFLNN